MNTFTKRQELLNKLANVCQLWSREELISFVYDRLYNELSEVPMHGLETMAKKHLTEANNITSGESHELRILPEKF